MNDKTSRFMITLLGGFLGIHKFLAKQTGMGVLYLLTGGLFGIGWIYDSICAFVAMFKNTPVTIELQDNTPVDSEYEKYLIEHEEISKVATKYYSGAEDIQAMWSVLYNLKIIDGPQVEKFETKCFENIADLNSMIRVEKKYRDNVTPPSHVPAYVRLAMLYEKQKNYQKAIDVCVAAIKSGAVNDGNNGKMYGRLARLIAKSGITVDNDILSLIDGYEE